MKLKDFKNVLVLYKRSAYTFYFLEKDGVLRGKVGGLAQKETARFKKAHDEHYATLKEISRVLLTQGIQFTENYRGRATDYSQYDLIITVGGDGTFLEASRYMTNQVIVGVNSAPSQSVGNYCLANASNFEAKLAKILNKEYEICSLQRIRVHFPNKATSDALNDILICHENPSMLSRYFLEIGKKREEQRSSGIWVSTASGSSAGIQSAGGKVLNNTDKKFQYLPRELYQGIFPKYTLTGKTLNEKQVLSITSIMRKGKIFIDGARHNYPFHYGDKIKIKLSPKPIKTVILK